MKTYFVRVLDECGVQSWPFSRSSCSISAPGPSQAAEDACARAVASRRDAALCRVLCPDGWQYAFDVTGVRISCSVKWRRQ